ncbi:alpha/beta-hydrolase [Truncatella angustata]|uniref:Alpha/beta-hydrolase n=1 Tax=Truncatella angustata TaxID=152316 RepID=A0A9P8ZVZ2_9PEZI|nr:alpha/beta-hydrolase [Truncatella angustata]KAH6651438.1 alpha/beta-hydrolase [Truncatella angustata]
MSKPTVVIVPGAWQMPAAFDNFSRKLNEAGYPTYLVELPSVGGTEMPLSGLAGDIQAVRSALNQVCQDGKKAMVLAHSAGGLSGSNAIEGYDVAGIIYLAAFVIPKGTSVLELVGGAPLPWMDVQDDRVFARPNLVSQTFFNDLAPELQAKWASAMTHTSAALFATPSQYEPWANGVPRGYIFCSDDNALPPPYQQQMIAQLGPEVVIASLHAGHCPHLSVANELLHAFESIVSQLRASEDVV